MSRLTATQIVAQGDYLQPDFDPASLTVSQLLGVLGYHNIPYPTPYSKSKLVALFNDKLKPRASKFKKERIKKANSIASDDGITDGLTGEPIGGNKQQQAPVRRSSRRLSRPPEDHEESTSSRPDPPKRRRSSAQPRLGEEPRRSRVRAINPVLVEESEPEEEIFSSRKAGKSTDEDTAGSTNRRLQADDSGWEDNNIFQSGAESSSPMRPSPIQPKRRRSAMPRKSRKSQSAPPDVSPQPLPRFIKPEPLVSPPRSTFSPVLSDDIYKTGVVTSRRVATPRYAEVSEQELEAKVEEAEDDDLNLVPVGHGGDEPEEPADDGEDEPIYQMDTDEEQVALIQQRLSGDDAMPIPVDNGNDEAASPLMRAFIMVIIIALLSLSVVHKLDSEPLGFCDRGSNTNKALESLRQQRAEIRACETRLAQNPNSTEVCPSHWPLPNELLPDACTPCPEHGTCAGATITCDTGFIQKPHPLLFFLPPRPNEIVTSVTMSTPPADAAWLAISKVFDGLPGFGSVAFPPRCGVDEKRLQHIGSAGRLVLRILADKRGDVLCNGGPGKRTFSDSEGGEARTWGMKLSELREIVQKIDPRTVDTFDDAIGKLPLSLIVIGEDKVGNRYYAHKNARLNWQCSVIVKSRETWEEWRMTVIGIATSIAYAYWLKRRRSQAHADRLRVRGLTRTVYEALQNQELAHHTDPVQVPVPFLSSVQLRDLILQDEHSAAARQRLWRKVENEVEANTNVRTNLEEVAAGDEQRVWRWVGSGRLAQS